MDNDEYVDRVHNMLCEAGKSISGAKGACVFRRLGTFISDIVESEHGQTSTLFVTAK